MTATSNPLDAVHLPAAFEPVYLPECDSVMAETVRRARSGAPEGTLVWAGSQAEARGRFGRPWISPIGGLYCALILRPELETARLGEFLPLAIVAMGAGLAELVTAMTDLKYVWPNAVHLSGGRAAGAWLAADPDWLVLATAVNVVAPTEPEHFRHACLTTDGGNPEATVARMLEAYVRHLAAWLARWDEEGPGPVIRSLRGRLGRRQDAVTLCLPDRSRITGHLNSVDDSGALLLDTGSGVCRVGINEYMGL